MAASAEVVVVGAGVVGTAITYFLAREGVRVCLLERGDIASGTSSACGHAVALQTKVPGPKLELARQSLALFHRLAEELETDIEFERCGSTIVAETEAEVSFLQAKVAKLQAAGVPVEFVDSQALRSLHPALSPHLLAASYCPEDVTLNPMSLALGFVRAARRLGAEVRTFTEVVGIELQNPSSGTAPGRIAAVVTRQGRVLTDTVVNAAGVWSPVLARMVGLELPIAPRKGELFVTEPVPPLWRGLLVSARYLLSKALPAKGENNGGMKAGVVAGRTRRGNLLVGSTREFVGYDRRSTYRAIQELVRQVTALVPALERVHVLRFYAGLRPTTPDGLPLLGRSPGCPGFIIAAGHEGDGIALAPVTGRYIADLITGQIDDEALAPFALSRFQGQGWASPAPKVSHER